jgi:hypothetical protein
MKYSKENLAPDLLAIQQQQGSIHKVLQHLTIKEQQVKYAMLQSYISYLIPRNCFFLLN